MTYEKKMRPAPYLQKIQDQMLLSDSRLAKLANLSRHTVRGIKAGQDARPETIEKLATALGVLPEDLTGRPGMSPEQMNAFLDSLAAQPTSYGPGDHIYDTDLIASRTYADLSRLKLENRELRHRIEVLEQQSEKMRAAVEAADEERQKLEAEGQPDAG